MPKKTAFLGYAEKICYHVLRSLGQTQEVKAYFGDSDLAAIIDERPRPKPSFKLVSYIKGFDWGPMVGMSPDGPGKKVVENETPRPTLQCLCLHCGWASTWENKCKFQIPHTHTHTFYIYT